MLLFYHFELELWHIYFNRLREEMNFVANFVLEWNTLFYIPYSVYWTKYCNMIG